MDSRVYLKKVGQNIKRIRLQKGLTQVELGYLCDWEKSTVYRIETGGTNITLLNLKKIGESLGVSVDELIKFEDKKKR